METLSKIARGVEGVIATPWTFIQYVGKTGTYKGFSDVNEARIKSFVEGNYGDIGENAALLGKGLGVLAEKGAESVKKGFGIFPMILFIGGVIYIVAHRK